MEERLTKTNNQKTLLEFHKSTCTRLEHIEKLLLGLATLGLTGWGLLLVASFEIPGGILPGNTTVDQSANVVSDVLKTISWIIFTSFFSGLVGSAYAGLYIARMGINRSILEMEPHITSPIRPFTRYFEIVGKPAAALVYFATGLFLPFLSIVSLGITAAWLHYMPATTIPIGELKVFIWLLILTMAISVISLSIVMMISIVKQLSWRSGNTGNRDDSTSQEHSDECQNDIQAEQESSD